MTPEEQAVADAAAKAVTDKAAADKVVADKTAADADAAKVLSDKAAADKIAADKVIADKVISDKAETELLARQKTQHTQTVKDWETQTKADKDLGGDKYAATHASLKRAMDRFAPPGSAFRKLVDDTGYGNHPEFVRFVSNIGAAMGEDGTKLKDTPGDVKETAEDRAKKMYPKSYPAKA